MLILSEKDRKDQHESAKKGLTDQFNKQMENILNANKSVDRYWILGKVRFPTELGGHVGRTFLEACLEKPPLIKSAFLYEVDNRQGCKTLLWVMHPDDSLALPTVGKTLSFGKKSRKTTGIIA